MISLADIEAVVYDRLGLSAAPGTAKVAEIRRSINMEYQQLMAHASLRALRRQLLTFSCLSDSPFVTLPQAVVDVFSVADRTRDWLLHPVGMGRLRHEDPGVTLTGDPYAFAKYNLQSAVTQQPSNASAIYAKSTVAGDGAAKTIYMECIKSDGSMSVESAALNGVTAVQIGSISTVSTITKLWIAVTATGAAATATGTISVHEDSGVGTQLSSIFPGRGAARFSLLHLYPTPTSVITYTADCRVLVTPLANGGDEPLIPQDYRSVLAHAAIMAGCQGRENSTTFQLARGQYKDVRGDLILFASRMEEPNSLHAGMRYSQLGSYFPPGS